MKRALSAALLLGIASCGPTEPETETMTTDEILDEIAASAIFPVSVTAAHDTLLVTYEDGTVRRVVPKDDGQSMKPTEKEEMQLPPMPFNP
jgi:hypothetical protein